MTTRSLPLDDPPTSWRSCLAAAGSNRKSPHPSASPARSRSRALRQRNQRVETYRALVRPLAIHYARCSQESSEDLIQVGLLGLIRAAELYSRERKIPFEAFARPHIRGAILHYLRDVAPRVRLPRRQAELQERLNRLFSTDGRPRDQRIRTPSISADHAGASLGVSDEQWSLLARQGRSTRLCRWRRPPAGKGNATPVDVRSSMTRRRTLGRQGPRIQPLSGLCICWINWKPGRARWSVGWC